MDIEEFKKMKTDFEQNISDILLAITEKTGAVVVGVDAKPVPSQIAQGVIVGYTVKLVVLL